MQDPRQWHITMANSNTAEFQVVGDDTIEFRYKDYTAIIQWRFNTDESQSIFVWTLSSETENELGFGTFYLGLILQGLREILGKIEELDADRQAMEREKQSAMQMLSSVLDAFERDQ